jgi:hypothetical protein
MRIELKDVDTQRIVGDIVARGASNGRRHKATQQSAQHKQENAAHEILPTLLESPGLNSQPS